MASALDLHEQIKSRQLSAKEAVDAVYQQIEAQDAQIGAFLNLTREAAEKTAAAVDQKVSAGEPLPLLAGVPIALKDNMNVTGYPTTCASRILEGYVSPYNATVTDKVNTHLLPIVGKTNMDEFAMGSSNENSAIKPVRNPVDPERVPGGSSGGSAAAVAADMVPISLGSDTGGSVRQPASLCGLVGLKPTYGRVSRYGLVAFASSLDQISPFTTTVKDAAALLQVISGFDPCDATSEQQPVPDWLSVLDDASIDGLLKRPLRVGVIQELADEGLQPDVKAAFEKVLSQLAEAGVETRHISIPVIEQAIAAYYVIATAEASSNLARFDGVRYGKRLAPEGGTILDMYKATRGEGFGDEVKRRIMLGTFALSSGYYDAYYGKGLQARDALSAAFAHAFEQVDVLVCPTSPTTAFKLGERVADPIAMYLSDIATVPVNLVGVPAISVPCGKDSQGLPIGFQVIGPYWREDLILQVARAIEQRQ